MKFYDPVGEVFDSFSVIDEEEFKHSFLGEDEASNDIHYNLRVMNSVYARKPRTTAYGLETISFLGQNLWQDLPLHIKKSQSVKHFKTYIKV